MVCVFTLATCIWDWYASDNNLPGTPRGSRKKPNAVRSPRCSLWTADANSHIPCRSPAVALRGRFQNGIFVAWQENGMACVNQTRPHCVNERGKTQFKPLAERHGRVTAWGRHGMCESALSVGKSLPVTGPTARMCVLCYSVTCTMKCIIQTGLCDWMFLDNLFREVIPDTRRTKSLCYWVAHWFPFPLLWLTTDIESKLSA
jgi:hypothetical protein